MVGSKINGSGDLPVISSMRVVIKDSGMPVSGMAGTAGLTEGCRWNNAAAGYARHPDGPGRSNVIQGHVRVGQGSRRNPLLDGIHAGLRQAKASRYGVTRRDALCHHRSTASAYSRAIPRCLPRTTCICCSGATRARCHSRTRKSARSLMRKRQRRIFPFSHRASLKG